MKEENELIYETSPYLLQHAHNPVHWKAWNENTLALAQRENKPLLISIGYAACHWCHVMERETFENKEAADLMNKNFVCIKVDREERPDVDQVYMAAAQLINGNGGWPLNALAFPDGKPFFAATYFPRDRWMGMLRYFIQQFREDKDTLRGQAESISKGIRDINQRFYPTEVSDFSLDELKRIQENILRKTDPQFGGLNGSMKFPMASVWELLLELYAADKNEILLGQIELTLHQMANGGINDQLGGGFARYATDAEWMIPHFEKMLYDNAQLISLYSHAFQLNQNEIYKKVIIETIDFVVRELTADQGYCSSLDADSDGHEGAYYVWTRDEIMDILAERAPQFIDAFGVTPGGNFEEGKNVLHRIDDSSWNDLELDSSRKILLNIRKSRVKPALDDKVLTSWNAMMSIAFTDAGCALQEPSYLKKSKDILDFLLTDLLINTDELYRNYQKGNQATHGFLDDYAFLINALIHYYQATFEIHYLKKAKELTEYVLVHFYNPKNKMFYYNDNRFQGIFTRLVEASDNVIPSSNAVMAENLFILGTFFFDESWINTAKNMVRSIKDDMISDPVYYSYWVRLMMKFVKSPLEVVIAGKGAVEMLQDFHKYFLPECIFCGSYSDTNLPLLEGKLETNKTLIYVCSNRVCQMPVRLVSDAMKQIESIRK